jgi:hypothetical protein
MHSDIETVLEGCTSVQVELQRRRKFLRSRGASSVAELVAGAANVFGYLCGEWFRLAGPASGRFHKRETLPERAAVQAAFVSGSWSGAVGGEKVPRRPSVDPGGGALRAGLRGYVLDGCWNLAYGR